MSLFCIFIAGPSGSGKTTIAEQIIGRLSSEGVGVSFIKDIPHDDADFDLKGKDTYRAVSEGAAMSIGRSPSKTFITMRGNMDLSQLLQIAEHYCSVCVVEGFTQEVNSLHAYDSIFLRMDQEGAESWGTHIQVRSDKGIRNYDLKHGNSELLDFIASLIRERERNAKKSK